MNRVLALSALWLASVATVLAPTASHWAEAWHGEEHSQIHPPLKDHDRDRNHGDCDAWQAQTDSHEDHSDLRFESVQAVTHGDHAGLCGSCSINPVAAPNETQFGDRAPLLSLGPASAPGSADHLSFSLARPRAPPAV